jgi:hypothetical protein
VCEEFSTGAIHFGDVLSHAVMSRTLNVQNLGRRTRQVTWACSDPKGGKSIFHIKPHKLELVAKAAGSFILSGSSAGAAKVEELAICTGVSSYQNGGEVEDDMVSNKTT